MGALALVVFILTTLGCAGGGPGSPPPPPTVTLKNVGAYYGATSQLNLPYAIAGAGDFTLLANGTGFTTSSVIEWNGSPLVTTFGDTTDLGAAVSASLIATQGTVSISVKDSSTGATSNALAFGIASPAAATAGVVQLITIASDGTSANADSLVAPSISADGRYVAFQSAATNLVSGPASGFQDIYIRDTCLGAAPPTCSPSTTRISVTFDGSPTNGHSRDSSISRNGRFVAFDSQATNILPGTAICGGTSNCVFLRDTCAGVPSGCTPTTTAISVDTQGAIAPGGFPILTPDGRFVSFGSGASNLVTQGTNAVVNVFLRDTCFGAPSGCTPGTALGSLSSAGAQGNQNSEFQAVSATSRFLSFESFATNMVPNESGTPGMFVRDTCFGASSCTPSTIRADVATDGSQANGSLTFNVQASLSGDGRLIAFASLASNLVSTSLGGWANVYVRDTCAGAPVGCKPATSLVSLGNDSSVGNNGSSDQAMTADGRFIAFSSLASNLVPGDSFQAGSFKDIFVRDTCFGAASGCLPSTVRVSVTNTPSFATQATDISDYPAISADGHYVVFLSAASNLAPGITGNGHQMVYLANTGF